MKQTIFHITKRLTEKENEHRDRKVDFIYEPNEYGKLKFGNNDNIFIITSMVDEFTENESAQIRHVHVIEHEIDGVTFP